MKTCCYQIFTTNKRKTQKCLTIHFYTIPTTKISKTEVHMLCQDSWKTVTIFESRNTDTTKPRTTASGKLCSTTFCLTFLMFHRSIKTRVFCVTPPSIKITRGAHWTWCLQCLSWPDDLMFAVLVMTWCLQCLSTFTEIVHNKVLTLFQAPLS